MQIRRARPADLPELHRIYAAARQFMARTGNPNQWVGDYPNEALLLEQIGRGVCYLMEQDGRAVGAFCAIPGEDPTYAAIYGGEWPNDDPYLTIHRLASDGRVRGVAKACFDFCAVSGLALRIDTHADNRVMQTLLVANGFAYCGRILLADGRPRLAYCRPANWKGYAAR